MKNTTNFCLVCGYKLDFVPWVGSDSQDICDCCGIQYGVDDMEFEDSERASFYAGYRAKWISDGTKWWSTYKKAPRDWDAQKQLDNII